MCSKFSSAAAVQIQAGQRQRFSAAVEKGLKYKCKWASGQALKTHMSAAKARLWNACLACSARADLRRNLQRSSAQKWDKKFG